MDPKHSATHLKHKKKQKTFGAHSQVYPGANLLAAADGVFFFFSFTFTVRNRREVKQDEWSNCGALSQVQRAEIHLGCSVG